MKVGFKVVKIILAGFCNENANIQIHPAQCAKSHSGICSTRIHYIVYNDFVSGQ